MTIWQYLGLFGFLGLCLYAWCDWEKSRPTFGDICTNCHAPIYRGPGRVWREVVYILTIIGALVVLKSCGLEFGGVEDYSNKSGPRSYDY